MTTFRVANDFGLPGDETGSGWYPCAWPQCPNVVNEEECVCPQHGSEGSTIVVRHGVRRDNPSPPRLSAADLMVLIDAALGSLHISDRGMSWKYTEETRRNAAQRAIDLLQATSVDSGIAG